MPTLDELRQKMPDLQGLDDQTALTALHEAYYPEMDRGVLGAHLGVKQPVAVDDSSDVMRGAKVALGQTVPILKGVVGLAGATAENAFGEGGLSTGVKNWGLRGYQEGMQKLQPMQKDTDELTTAWDRAKDGDLGALVDWAQYGIGYAIGQGGESLAMALLGGAAGAAVAPEAAPVAAAGGAITGLVAKGAVRSAAVNLIERSVVKEAGALMSASAGKLTAEEAVSQATKSIAKNIGSTSALLAYGGAQELGSIYPEAEAQAAEEKLKLNGGDLARIWASGLVAGGVEGLTDKLGVEAALGKVRIPGAKSRLGSGVLTGAAGALVEGGTEAAQTAIERYGAGQEITSPEGVKDIINSAGLGAIGGGAIGGVAGAVHGPRIEQAAIEDRANRAMRDLGAATTVDDAIAAFDNTHVPLVPPQGLDAEGALTRMEAQMKADQDGLKDRTGRLPEPPWMREPNKSAVTAGFSGEASATAVPEEAFGDRLITLREQLKDSRTRQQVRDELGPEALNDVMYYAQRADDENLPGKTSDRMLSLAESILGRALLKPLPDRSLGMNPSAAAPPQLAAPAGAAAPMIGMDTAPTGTMRVDAAGNAAPETRADAINTSQAAQRQARPDGMTEQAPQGSTPGAGVMVGQGQLTPGATRREPVQATSMQLALQKAGLGSAPIDDKGALVAPSRALVKEQLLLPHNATDADMIEAARKAGYDRITYTTSNGPQTISVPDAIRGGESGRTQEGTTARAAQASAIQDVAERQRQVSQPEESVFPQLRGARDQNVSGVASQFPGISEGDRRAPDDASHAGPQGEQRELRAWQYAVGDEEGTGTEHAQKPPADVARSNANADDVGRRNRAGSVNASIPSEAGRNVSGGGADNGQTQHRTPTLDKTPEQRLGLKLGDSISGFNEAGTPLTGIFAGYNRAGKVRLKQGGGNVHYVMPDSVQRAGKGDAGAAVTNGQAQASNGAKPSAASAPTVERTDSLSRVASWVIREKATGKVIAETFDRKKVEALNTDKYEAVPIQEHLGSLNNQGKPRSGPPVQAKPASAGTTAALQNMVEEGDYQAAFDYAEVKGASLDGLKLSKDDRSKLDAWLKARRPDEESEPQSALKDGTESVHSLGSLVESLIADHPGLKLDVSERGGDLSLSRVVLPKDARGAGAGTKIMEALTNFADANGKRMVLTASTDFGATSRARLVAFYKRFGFVENKGRAKDFTISEGMYRDPQSTRAGSGIAGLVSNPDTGTSTIDPKALDAMKDGAGVLDWLTKNAADPLHRSMAARLNPFIGDVEVAFVKAGDSAPDSVARRLSNGSTAVAELRPDGTYKMWFRVGEALNDAMLLHESIHAATMKAFIGTKNAALRADMQNVLAAIRRSFTDVEHTERIDPSQRKEAAFFSRVLEDEDELLAYAFSSPTLRRWMQNMNANGKFIPFDKTEAALREKAENAQPWAPSEPTMWQKFVDAVRSLLGLGKVYAPRIEAMMADREQQISTYIAANKDAALYDRLDEFLQQAMEANAKAGAATTEQLRSGAESAESAMDDSETRSGAASIMAGIRGFNQEAARNLFLDATTSHGSTAWINGVRTQYAKAQKNPTTFGRVFEAVQDYIKDISVFANAASNLAPNILPKLETLHDIVKGGLFRHGADPADLKAAGAALWQGTLKDKKVFTKAELRAMGLTGEQIDLYREARAAIDQSLDDLGRTEIVRLAGSGGAPVAHTVMAQKTLADAADVLTAHLRSVNDEATATMIEEKVAQIQKLKTEGYAPLMRFGRYTLHITRGNATEFFGMYESRRDANRAARELRDDPEFAGADFKQGRMSQKASELYAGMPLDALELFADTTGRADNPVYQDFLKLTKNNRSALKRLIKRQGIAGFSEDTSRVLASFVTSNARAASGNMNLGRARAAAEAIPKEQGDLKDDAISLLGYVQNPQEEAAALRGMLFTNFIGGSVASAAVNLTQPFTMTMPYLSQFGGVVKAAGHLIAAARAAAGGKASDEVQAALDRAEADGIVSPQEIHHLQAEAMNRLGNNPVMKKAAFVWGSMFSLSEQFNRRVTFIAAYNTAKEHNMADPFAFAEKAVIETQGLYNKGNKPNLARGAIGSTVFTFKQFSIHYLEFLTRMAQSGPEGKKAVAVALAVLMLTAGAGGLPFADDLDDLIDTLAQAMGYDFSSKRAKRRFISQTLGLGDMVADVATRGLSALPGMPIDVSLRMGMGNLIPGTGALLRSNTDRSKDVLEFAGAAGSFAKSAMDAGTKALQGNFAEAGMAVAPLAVQNMAKALSMFNTGEYRNAKDQKVKDTDWLDASMKFIGFQPAGVARESQQMGEVQRSVQLAKNVEAEISAKWAQGIHDREPEKVASAKQELSDWNADNPGTPMRITLGQVLKRVKEMNQSRAQRAEKSAPRELRPLVREAFQ